MMPSKMPVMSVVLSPPSPQRVVWLLYEFWNAASCCRSCFWSALHDKCHRSVSHEQLANRLWDQSTNRVPCHIRHMARCLPLSLSLDLFNYQWERRVCKSLPAQWAEDQVAEKHCKGHRLGRAVTSLLFLT